MSLTRGVTGKGLTEDGNEELAYDSRSGTTNPDRECRKMRVQCLHITVGLFVRIPALHGTGGGVFLHPLASGLFGGTVQVFEFSSGEMYINPDGGQTDVAWGPVG